MTHLSIAEAEWAKDAAILRIELLLLLPEWKNWCYSLGIKKFWIMQI
jgi:hypothetical protein